MVPLGPVEDPTLLVHVVMQGRGEGLVELGGRARGLDHKVVAVDLVDDDAQAPQVIRHLADLPFRGREPGPELLHRQEAVVEGALWIHRGGDVGVQLFRVAQLEDDGQGLRGGSGGRPEILRGDGRCTGPRHTEANRGRG